MTTTTATKTMELTLTRMIPADPAEVFDAWMDPKHPGNPWTGAKKLIFDGRVDGLFYFLHLSKAGDGEEWAHYGRFVVIERARRLQYRWMSPFTLGLESTVTVTFEKKGDETLITLNHAGLPDDEKGRLHDPGWKRCLDGFAEPFRAARPH